MSEEEDTPRRHVRFPFVAAVLCAACVAMAAWLWIKYSCCHEMVIGDAYDFPMRDLEGEYVRLKGALGVTTMILRTGRKIRRQWFVYDRLNLDKKVYIYQRGRDAAPHGVTDGFTGRIVCLDSYPEPVLDTTAGRLTGASIAGLLVGVWGV
ncbi:MAG: hypothetical protein ACYTFI_22285, partial [Planctomycetota bacterium]